MVLCPLQNTTILKQNYVQVRPYVTQKFGERPEVYKQFGTKGHAGIDLRAKVGVPVYAPHDGMVRITNTGDKGYGLHMRIRNPFKACESVLAHLSKVVVAEGQQVNMGDLIGYSGNTGFSSAPHLHWGFRGLKHSRKALFNWDVFEEKNGFAGYIDVSGMTITWKGTLTKNNI